VDSLARSGNNKSYRDQSQHSGTSVPSAMRHVYSRVRLSAERDAVYQQPQPRRTTKPVRSNLYPPYGIQPASRRHISIL
jgi:isocitrate lyase